MPETAPGTYKSQPWVLFDAVVADSFLWGDTVNGLARGTNIPAISANGEILFFNAGRTKGNSPVYTNMDQNGELAYGMEVWQIYLLLQFPIFPPIQNTGFDYEIDAGVSPTLKLAESILNFGVLILDLGQENQMYWPLTRFGGGGGLVISDIAGSTHASNALQNGANMLALAESIEMPRTQNISATIRLSPDCQSMIGTAAAPGVGSPLAAYTYGTAAETDVDLDQLPFKIELGLVGRRIKKTQYGQIPAGSTGQ